MYSVLFSVIYIKRGGGAKALYIHLYAHTRICTSGCVSKDKVGESKVNQLAK